MERKFGKFQSLKNLMSSSTTLNHSEHCKASCSSPSSKRNNARSLFNLLSVKGGDNSERSIAAKFFHNIRSKLRFRRHPRERKIVDSKSSDYLSFFSGDKEPRYSEEFPTTPNHSRHGMSSSVDNLMDGFISYGSRRISNEDGQRVIINGTRLPEGREEDGVDVVEQLHEDGDDVYDHDGENSNDSQSRGIVAIPPTVPSKPTKCLTEELDDLLHYGWYWAGLSKDEAEDKLKGQPDGAFVVRDSSSDHYLLSLSFNCNDKTLHTRIEYRNGLFSFYSSDADTFPSVAQLIEHCMAYSEFGVFCYSRARRSHSPSYPVRLTKPISRFTEVKSLLYLSRFALRQRVRFDLIPKLPLPPSLIDFVSEQRYI